MESKWIEATVLGKWIMGFIFKKPMISVEIQNMDLKYAEVKVDRHIWFKCEKGQKIFIKYYKHQNGLWYQWSDYSQGA